MATQSQSAISQTAAAPAQPPMQPPMQPPTQPPTQPRPAAALGAAQTGSGMRAEEAASGTTNGGIMNGGTMNGGTTNLVATGAARDSAALAIEEHEVMCLSAPLERLPVDLVVSVPVREFRVRNLLGMASGALIETQWGHGEDLPLTSGDVQLAWTEFEVVDTRLAVRVTRLA
jgi:flagellar motor switch/type III secretory pathway protein FliN